MTPATMFLAKLWGPVFIVAAIGILVNMKSLPAIIKIMKKDPAKMFFWGYMILMLGVLLVNVHNLWIGVPAVIVSILGWATALKGAAFLVFPRHTLKLSEKFIKVEGLYAVSGVFMIGIGVYLTYAGYFI